jgi:hypothetical protein
LGNSIPSFVEPGQERPIWSVSYRIPNMREISLVEGIAFLLELLYHRGPIHGIPDNDGIGDQIQATGLISQHLATGMTQVALIRDHQKRSEVMQRLALFSCRRIRRRSS